MLIEVKRYLAQPLRVTTASVADFDRLLSDHYAVDSSAAAMAGSLDGSDIDFSLPSAEDLLDSADDAPAIRLINAIIAEAVRQGVSDIHIEPYESGLVVRMRTDGVLREHLAHAAARRPGRRQPHQGDGAARHRRTPRAAGRPHRADARGQGGRRARLDAAEPRAANAS